MEQDNGDLPSGVEQPGGFIQYTVGDVHEATALAQRLKSSGRYRYFRGQRDASWEIRSSFARLDEAQRAEEIEKFSAFYGWITDSPELVPYLSNDDMIIATAQHHGIAATNFVDFTTDPQVAGWFATDGGLVGDNGVIFMIDSEAEGALNAFAESVPIIRFLDVDVANLWRLQAQHGLFLETQTDIHRVWPPDRIVFPQNGEQPNIERRRIYPDRRSHLEQMIDQHLLLKQREDNMREFLDGSNFYHIEIGDPPDLTPADLPVQELPESLRRSADERWPALDIDSEPPAMHPEQIESGGEILERIVETRRASLDLLVVEPDPPRRNGTIQAAIDLLWSGMRPHPYHISQMARATSTLARYLRVFGDFPLSSGVSPMRAAPELLIDPVEIEMGIIGGGSTRAAVAGTALLSALTPEARKLLNLDPQAGGKAVMDALQPYYGNTLRLFDKVALVELFAEEIVPWQVATRRNPVAFWPNHIESLGRP